MAHIFHLASCVHWPIFNSKDLKQMAVARVPKATTAPNGSRSKELGERFVTIYIYFIYTSLFCPNDQQCFEGQALKTRPKFQPKQGSVGFSGIKSFVYINRYCHLVLSFFVSSSLNPGVEEIQETTRHTRVYRGWCFTVCIRMFKNAYVQYKSLHSYFSATFPVHFILWQKFPCVQPNHGASMIFYPSISGPKSPNFLESLRYKISINTFCPLSIPTVLVEASSFRTWHFRTSSVWWLMKLCRRAVGFKRWTCPRVCIIPVLFYPSDTNWRFEVVLICVGLGMFLIQHFKQYPKTKG